MAAAMATSPETRAPYRVIRTGMPELLPEITDEMIEAGTPDPEQRRLAFQLGLRSAMVVPLIVGEGGRSERCRS